MGDMFRPAMIAIKLLKLPMLKHSRPVSIQYSTVLTRCFFFWAWNERRHVPVRKSYYYYYWNTKTYFAHLSGHKITEPIEPLDVLLQISRLLQILKRGFQSRILLGERLDEFFRPDERQSFQFDVCQLLGELFLMRTRFRYIGTWDVFVCGSRVRLEICIFLFNEWRNQSP